MLTSRQFRLLSVAAIALWALATASIRYFPSAVTDPLAGNIGFVTSVPVFWLCVVVTRRWARLTREQLVAGTAFVVALAMLIDASALRWVHVVYSDTGAGDLFRLGSAWLLWGYGISLVIALVMANRPMVGQPS